ncbi:hypothetical protein [Nocardioides sambongensis]|uniref:hypothetical protein n=1 Tax=Nocardioides sambongensis TaxID=2589074 RepID=UPI00112C61C1|nr:hypothetical protein [Nocardioides sambongensis]
MLLDEIKTGSPRVLDLTRTRLQVAGYVLAAAEIWPEKFLGARLLSTFDSASSMFIDPALEAVALETTPYRK